MNLKRLWMVLLALGLLCAVVADEPDYSYIEEFFGTSGQYDSPFLELIDNNLWFDPLPGWAAEGTDVYYFDPEYEYDYPYYRAALFSIYLFFAEPWDDGGLYDLSNKRQPAPEFTPTEFNLPGEGWSIVDEQLFWVTQFYYDNAENIEGPFEGDGFIYYTLDSWGMRYVEAGFPVDDVGFANFYAECELDLWPQLQSQIWEMLTKGVAACNAYLAEMY